MTITLPAPDPAAAGLLLALYQNGLLNIPQATRMCPELTASQVHAALEVFVAAGLATLIESNSPDVYMPLMDDAPARREYARLSGARACRSCGCTDLWACDGGCAWVEDDLCSACDPGLPLLSQEVLTELLSEVKAAQAHVEASSHLRRNQTSGILGSFAGCIQDVLRGALPVLAELPAQADGERP